MIKKAVLSTGEGPLFFTFFASHLDNLTKIGNITAITLPNKSGEKDLHGSEKKTFSEMASCIFDSITTSSDLVLFFRKEGEKGRHH